MARERLDRHGSRQKRKQSSKTERESKTSPLTVLAVLIIFMIIVYTMSIVYSSSSDRDVPGLSMITSLFNVGSSESAVSTAVHDKLHEYEEIVLKARHLAMRYKNITGKSPPGASPVTTNGDTNNKPTESSEQQHTSSSSSVTSWLRNHIGIGNSHNFLRPTGGAPVNDGTQTSASATTKQSESDVSKTGTTTADSTTIGATDLIIGIAQDTDPKNLAVFCKSLRRYIHTPNPKKKINKTTKNATCDISNHSIFHTYTYIHIYIHKYIYAHSRASSPTYISLTNSLYLVTPPKKKITYT